MTPREDQTDAEAEAVESQLQGMRDDVEDAQAEYGRRLETRAVWRDRYRDRPDGPRQAAGAYYDRRVADALAAVEAAVARLCAARGC